MNARISISSVLFFVGSCALSLVIAFLGQPLVHENESVVTLLVTTFSILAGILIAVLTLLADPALLPGSRPQTAELAKIILGRKLNRHRYLFLVYLLTLVLIMVALLIEKDFQTLALWLERVYLFLAAVGLAYSFKLPWTLARLQEERFDAEIAERERKRGGG